MRDDPSALARGLRKMAGRLHDEDAELVAASTIGLSALAGLPVSTTHVLSSGVAGTMVANRSGLQKSTVRSILLAWVLTLPATIALSGVLFLLFRLALA